MTDFTVGVDGTHSTIGEALNFIYQGVMDTTIPAVSIHTITCLECVSNGVLQVGLENLDLEIGAEGVYVEEDDYQNLFFDNPILGDAYDLKITIKGAPSILPRSVLWFHSALANVSGLLPTLLGVTINFESMILFSPEGGSVIVGHTGTHVGYTRCLTYGQGSLCTITDGTFTASNVRVLEVNGSRPWDVTLLGNPGWERMHGDWDNHSIIIDTSRMGVIRTSKTYSITNCSNNFEGFDGIEEVGPFGSIKTYREDPKDQKWYNHRRLGNLLDDVNLIARNRSTRVCPLTIRSGGLFRRLRILRDPKSEEAGVLPLGEDTDPHYTAVRYFTNPDHYVVFQHCLFVNFYRGIVVEDKAGRAGVSNGTLIVADSYFKYVDLGIVHNAQSNNIYRQEEHQAGGIEGVILRNVRWTPRGFGTPCPPPALFHTDIQNPPLNIDVECSNGPVSSQPRNCSGGGYQEADDAPQAGYDDECKALAGGDTVGAPMKSCDFANVYLTTLPEDKSILNMTSIEDEAKNHPGCSSWRIVWWTGDPDAGLNGTQGRGNIHVYQWGEVLADGTMNDFQPWMQLPLRYGGRIYIQFSGCAAPGGTMQAFDNGMQAFPIYNNINEETDALLPSSAVIPPDEQNEETVDYDNLFWAYHQGSQPPLYPEPPETANLPTGPIGSPPTPPV